MKRHNILFLISLFLSLNLLSQGKEDYCSLAPVLKSQIFCYQDLAPKDTIFYHNIIASASRIRPMVIGEIERQDPTSSFCHSNHYNIIEGCSSEGDLYGLIWTDSIYYWYVNGASSGLGSSNASKVIIKKISDLYEDERAIVRNFDDWNNCMFRSTRKSIQASSHPSYYIASRVWFSDTLHVSSMAFCY